MNPTIRPVYEIHNAASGGPIALICEHASNYIPKSLDELGLSAEQRDSHFAWDPGAFPVAQMLAEHLAAPLLTGGISRLVYDCNRAPGESDAIVADTGDFKVPGNQDLSEREIQERVNSVYRPFERGVEAFLRARPEASCLVTVHTFTREFRGHLRGVEIGVLHGEDARLALALKASAAQFTQADVRLNEPYGPNDRTSHTLNLHGVRRGLLNVMIEVRNDLVTTIDQQCAYADLLARWLSATLAGLQGKAS